MCLANDPYRFIEWQEKYKQRQADTGKPILQYKIVRVPYSRSDGPIGPLQSLIYSATWRAGSTVDSGVITKKYRTVVHEGIYTYNTRRQAINRHLAEEIDLIGGKCIAIRVECDPRDLTGVSRYPGGERTWTKVRVPAQNLYNTNGIVIGKLTPAGAERLQ